jgi:hypothetical protein
MTLSDLLNLTRILLAEPNTTPTGRWSDSDLTTLINQAQQQIALELDFPEASLTFSTTTGIQEYQMPELLKILRVYIAGQPIVPTTIPALEGDQIEFWDQTAANNQTQWQSQSGLAYPVAASQSWPNAGNTPWQQGNRPRFYMRGGNMGFVPKPSGVYSVQVDIVPSPPTLVNSTDTSIFDTKFKDAICWKTCTYAFFADSNSLMATATQNYELEMRKLRAWKEDIQKMLPRGVFPITTRTYFQGPVPKVPTSNGRSGG